MLEAAFKKLTHEQMDISAINMSDWDEARKLASLIQQKAKELEHAIYDNKKKLKELVKKK